MIGIAKGDAPEQFLSAGSAAKDAMVQLYQDDAQAYDTGKKKFTFADTVYASPVVRAALEKVHGAKCCYCEAPLPGAVGAHVEHWRPKAYAQQAHGASRQRPGYFWLAYDWSNLLWSCATCNCRKGNVFPLKDDTKRARNPSMPLSEELPAILSPEGTINPRDHIVYHQEVPKGITELGRKTIEVLGLDEFREDRLTQLKLVRLQRDVARLDGARSPEAQRLVQEARVFLRDAVQPRMAFSAMVADFLGQEG